MPEYRQHFQATKFRKMKKLVITLLAFFGYYISFAQIGRGSLIIGGNTSLGISRTEDQFAPGVGKSSEISITPSIGYSIHQNVFMGIGINYGKTWFPNKQSPNKSFGQHIGGFVFIRKYTTLGKKFYLFAEPSIFYSRSKQRLSSLQVVRNTDGWSSGFSLYPGVAYAVNKRLHLELGMNQLLGVSYERHNEYFQTPSTANWSSKQSAWVIGANVNQSLPVTIGARIILAK